MNQTTRTIIFFSSLVMMFLYYLMIIPRLPLAFDNAVLYANYSFSSFFICVPATQMLLRRRILARFKDDHLYEFRIHDAIAVQYLIYLVIGYLMLIRPLTASLTDFSNVEPINWLSFIGWLVVAQVLIALTYRSTKAQFCREHILIYGWDLRMDFPFGNPLYSHSGVYAYSDFEYYFFDGNRLTLRLKGELGKIVIVVPSEMQEQVGEYLKAQQLDKPKKQQHQY